MTSSTRMCVLVSVAAVSTLWASGAHAQEPAPSPPVTAGPPGTPPQPASTAPGSPAAAGPQKPTDEELAQKTRFRFAIHILGGPWFVPNRTGGGGGGGIQLGAQINDMVGVYYSGTGAVAVAGSDSKTGVGAAVGAFAYNSVMADVTLFRKLQLGAGPSLDSLAFGSADVSATPAGVPAAKSAALAGTYFGIQTRVGLALGGRAGKSGRFMLGLEVHPTFADVTLVSTFITLGGGSF